MTSQPDYQVIATNIIPDISRSKKQLDDEIWSVNGQNIT